MHLLLTDRLCCPRCGPEFGLILLADRLEGRRVYEGGLGCSNCRDSYPVRDGVGDLRAAPRSPMADSEAAPNIDAESDSDIVGAGISDAGPGTASLHGVPTAAEIGGLLGVLRGPGHLLVVGSLRRRAPDLAKLIEGIEVVAASPSAARGTEREGISRLIFRSRLPFQSGSLRGVALRERDQACDLAEAARVIAPGGRLAVFGPEPDVAGRVSRLGLEIVAEEDTRLVARR